MLANARPRLTYANVVASLALFVALGGTSYGVATGTIDSREVKNNSLSSKDIRNRTILGKDVKTDALTGRQIKNLGTGDIRDESLLAKDFAPGQLPR